MRKVVPILVLMLVSAILGSTVFAQTLEERLQKFGEDYAKGYTKPFVDAFGAGLNSGWYHTANVDDGLSLYFGVKAMLLPIPDDGKKFKIRSPYDQVEQEVSTAFGDETEVLISRTNIPAGITPDPEKYPKGFNIGFVPLAVPHISVGNIFGTRVMLRFFPKTKLGDYGEFEFLGFGVQHSISRHIPGVPLDIAANFGYQSLKLGSLISASAFTLGAQASKSLSILTVYGGLAYETSSMSFGYDAKYTDPTNPTGPQIQKHIGFDASGKNSFRFTMGVGLDLLILKINADYSLASQPAATVGVGIGW
jgi:hypothetical protein